MRKSIVELLCGHAACDPDRLAVIAVDGEASYGELWSLVRGCASRLHSMGLNRGDVVALRASQPLAYVATYLGVHLAGGTVAAVERSAPADRFGARMAITGDAGVLPAGMCVLDGEQFMWEARAQVPEELPFPGEEDQADVMFTTGTTGASKGVEITHGAHAAMSENLILGCGYRPDTRILVPGPLNHANPIRKLLASIANGSAIHILDGMMNLRAFFEALRDPRGSVACCLPPSAVRLLLTLSGDALGEFADRIDFIETCTAPLAEADRQRLSALLPHSRLYVNYGSSEAGSVCAYDYNAHPGKPGCISRPLKNVRIVAIDGVEDCICIATPHRITGQALRLLLVMSGDVDFSPRAFSAQMRERLEAYKVPEKYERVEQIARTYNGRLDRKFYRN